MKKTTRREFLKKSIPGAVGAAASASALSKTHFLFAQGEQQAPAFLRRSNKGDKPNLVYIFCDQLRYSALGLNQNKLIRTPHLNALSKESVVFDQAFSCAPICAPYRAQIITGRFAHKNGVICNEYKLFDDQVIMHEVLKRAGYHTAHIGKWHLGYGPYTEDKRYGLDYLFAHNCDHGHYSVEYYENERGPIYTHGWSPEIETTKAIEFIEAHCREHSRKPFSLYLGFGPPHNGYGGEKHLPYDMYPGEYNIYDPAEIEPAPNVPEPLADFARNEIADYYANVTGIDAQVGHLLAKLEELGIVENTIVCFSSDHGDHLRSYGYGGPWDMWLHHTKRANKATPHEEAIHIPFIIRYPDRVKGSRRLNILFSSVDVLPTLLSLCGLSIPEGVQGKDLSFAIIGEKGNEPDSVYLQILGPGWPHRGPWVGFWRGIRTHRYTYARWHNPEKYEHGIWLFDREKDIYEMNNLAERDEYKKIETNLEKRLQRWIAETDDPFDTGERDPKTGMLVLGQKFTHEKYNRSK